MAPFYLSAACCLPLPNPEARSREREIFRRAAQVAEEATRPANGRIRGRWGRKEKILESKRR